MRNNPSYLVRQQSSWCFRIRVPIDLQVIIGKKELRYTLTTGSQGEAKYRARRTAGIVQHLFRRVKRDMRKSVKELNNREVQTLLDNSIRQALEDEEEMILRRERPLQNDDQYMNWITELDGPHSDRLEALHLGNFKIAERSLQLTLEDAGISIADTDRDSIEYKRLLKEALRSDIKALELIIEMRKNPDLTIDDLLNTAKGIPPVQTSVIREAEPEEDSTELLSVIIEAYRKENIDSGNWKKRTIDDIKTCENVLIMILGDVPVQTVNFSTMRDCKAILQKLPKFLNSQRYQGKTIEEIIKIGESHNKLSITTINKYLGYASGLFNWARDNNYIKENPARGLQISQKKRKKRTDEGRKVFETDDLKKIFEPDTFIPEGRFASPYKFWIPLLGLYTGARLEEICQLTPDDIRLEGDIWIMDINDKDDKEIKNVDSIREIPLHPHLVETLRFPEYVQKMKSKKKDRIFYELKRVQHRYGHHVSPWFSGHIKKKCGIDEVGKSFHSFRHTFINYLKQNDFERSMVKQLTGHSDEDMTFGRYGKRYEPEKLYQDVIVNIDFGIDIDHLKKCKYVA